MEQTVHKKQWQKKRFYKGKQNSMIDLYNRVTVYVHNYNRGRPWVACVVRSKTGPLSYINKTGGWEGSQTTFGSDSENLTIGKT